jgi:hypothetical protein
MPNIRVIKPSRKKPIPGDYFVVQFPNDDYYFGRVISDQARWTIAKDANFAFLVYFYGGASRTRELPQSGTSRPGNLLVPPLMINRLPWSRGYFATVGNVPLQDSDILPVHCFHDLTRNVYRDENGEILAGPVKPTGIYGLNSYGSVDDALSRILGFPLASE